MLTEEDKTLIKMMGIKKARGKTINWRISKQEMEQAWCWGLSEAIANNGPLNEHPVVDVRARRALLRTLTLWGTWYRARRINPRHTVPLDRSHESSEHLKQITGDDFSVLLCYERKWTNKNSVFNWKVLLFKFTKYGAHTIKVMLQILLQSHVEFLHH